MQRVMTELLSDLLYKGVFIYVDDIIIYAKDLKEHIRLLEEVFQDFNVQIIK